MIRMLPAAPLLAMLASAPAFPETPAQARDKYQEVAIEKANMLALRNAKAIGTCIAYFADQGTCTEIPQGGYECRAAYADDESSCSRKDEQTLASQIREGFAVLDELCKEGRETACGRF